MFQLKLPLVANGARDVVGAVSRNPRSMGQGCEEVANVCLTAESEVREPDCPLEAVQACPSKGHPTRQYANLDQDLQPADDVARF